MYDLEWFSKIQSQLHILLLANILLMKSEKFHKSSYLQNFLIYGIRSYIIVKLQYFQETTPLITHNLRTTYCLRFWLTFWCHNCASCTAIGCICCSFSDFSPVPTPSIKFIMPIIKCYIHYNFLVK